MKAYNETKLLSLKEEIEEKKGEIAEKKGTLKHLKEQLKKDWQCSTTKEAQAKIDGLQRDINETSGRIAEGLEDLKTKYNVQV